ncbi:MAG: hypothetical protein JNM69_20160 [Archangium sp.]|nr:hypothetical protein [Archangium sp.]
MFTACLIPVTAGRDEGDGGSARGGGSSGGGSSGVGGGSSGFGGGSSGFGGGSSGFGGGQSSGAALSCEVLASLPAVSLTSLAIESPGALEARAGVFTTGWTTRNFRLDFDGGSLGTFDETWSHSGSGFGSRATHGGRSLVLGGTFSFAQSMTLYSGQQGQVFTDVPDTVDWTVHDVAYNPTRDEFALFWSIGGPSRIMMQTRFMDGGIGFTRTLMPNDFMGKPDAVSWTQGGYFVLGASSLHGFADDGSHLGTVALPGSPRSIASNRAGLAGASVESFDGGALMFVKFDSQNLQLSSLPLRSGIRSSSSRIVWDPLLSQWHIAYQVGFAGGPFSVASFRESGQLVRDQLVGCNVSGTIEGLAIDGPFLFLATVDLTTSRSSVLRVNLQ